MEWIDIINSQTGLKTGEKILKDLAHKTGQWHKSVYVWILNSKKELLIQKRALVKEFWPGLWDISAAGHISSGESSRECAVREIQEELGIKVNPDSLEYLFSVREQAVIKEKELVNNEYSDVYLIKLEVSVLELKLQAEEVDEVKWIKIEDLRKKIQSHDRAFLNHQEGYEKLFQRLTS